jgi:hypothetical protein
MRSHTRACALALVLSATSALTPSLAHAGPSLPSELDGLAEWLSHKAGKPVCAARCFALDDLELHGDGGRGELRFVLRGAVLAEGVVDVPLFGTPADVRLEDVKLDGHAATIGFDGDHYFLHTDARSFTLEGRIVLGEARALTVVGPVNALHGKLEAGRIVEGSSFSGLLGRVLHFDDGAPPKPVEVNAPPVFELSRSFRLGHEPSFEYRLGIRSGAEIGEVRLPLGLDERVVAVDGSADWKVSDGTLRMTLAGKAASVVIRGTLGGLGSLEGKSLSPDPRAQSETWTFDPDDEHRVRVVGDGLRLDRDKSAMPLGQHGQVWLLQRGRHLQLSTSTLGTMRALAATMHRSSSTVVLGERGDVVIDQTFQYAAEGVDFTALQLAGKPLYLATDGRADRLVRDGADEASLALPLLDGTHQARVQSLAHLEPNRWAGLLELPSTHAAMPVTHAEVRIGLPERIEPIAVLGGDRPRLLLSLGALALAAIGGVIGAWLGKRSSTRALGAIAGIGFAASLPTLFVASVATAALAAIGRAAFVRMSGSPRRRFGMLAAAVASALLGVALLANVRSDKLAAAPESGGFAVGQTHPALTYASATPAAEPPLERAKDVDSDGKPAAPGSPAMVDTVTRDRERVDTPVGGVGAALSTGEGTRSVAMALPQARRWLSVDAELVTADRPLRPRVWYVTTDLVNALLAAWIAASLLLAWRHRDAIARIGRWLSAPAEPPAAPTPAE